MECPRCGEQLRPGAHLCTRCGTWIGASAPAPAPRVETAVPPVSTLWAAPHASQRVEQHEPRHGQVAEVVVFDDGSELDEKTTISSRRKIMQSWTLTLPDGTVELVTNALIVGRAPESSPDLPAARLISLPDPTRSVSKNHAVFSLREGVFSVQDLGSTNGVFITHVNGREIDLGARGSHELEPGARVELGDVVLMVGKA